MRKYFHRAGPPPWKSGTLQTPLAASPVLLVAVALALDVVHDSLRPWRESHLEKGAPWPVTVAADVMLEEVVEAFVENRGSSVVVVDEDQRPIGRILADDLVDALLPEDARSLRAFTGLLS
jgi:CBS-domain-containing membrane protein